MCQGTLQVSSSCGHQTFRPLEICPNYSPIQNRCNGTLSILHTTTADSLTCARCDSRIAANIIRERDLVTTELEKEIADTERRLLWAERYRGFGYVALVFERARLREAVKRWWKEKEGELEELRGRWKRGKGERVGELRDDGRRMAWQFLD